MWKQVLHALKRHGVDVTPAGMILDSGLTFKIGSTTLTEAEIGAFDGVTAGTVTASKGLLVDANKDLASLRHLTLAGNLVIGATTLAEAELAVLDAVTPGTAAASKAVVLDGSSKINALDITALTLNGTLVTATPAELNILDDQVASFTFAAAAGGANVCEVTVTAKDAAGATIDRPIAFLLWLSDAATGAGLTGTAASGTVTAKAASGTDMGALTAKKALIAQTLADGTFILEITDTAKTGFYVCAQTAGGVANVSAQLVTGNYGS